MVTLSPDGTMSTWPGASATRWRCRRNATSGRLAFVEALLDGAGGVEGLAGAWSVATSPDGAHLYATGRDEDALAVFRRDPANGRLTPVEVVRDGLMGIDGIAGPWLVAVSPDGAAVYVAGTNDGALAVFARDPASGTLAFVERHANGLAGARGVTVSPDGRHVYATAVGDSAVAVFRRGVCGDRVVDAGECCDLGEHNGGPGAGCTATCGCTGRCAGSAAECAAAADCPPGEGCCGNGAVESGETCDDANGQDGDCCSSRCAIECDLTCVPACAGVSGPHLGAPLPMRLGLFDPDGRWRLRTLASRPRSPGKAHARNRAADRPRYGGCPRRPGRERRRLPARVARAWRVLLGARSVQRRARAGTTAGRGRARRTRRAAAGRVGDEVRAGWHPIRPYRGAKGKAALPLLREGARENPAAPNAPPARVCAHRPPRPQHDAPLHRSAGRQVARVQAVKR